MRHPWRSCLQALIILAGGSAALSALATFFFIRYYKNKEQSAALTDLNKQNRLYLGVGAVTILGLVLVIAYMRKIQLLSQGEISKLNSENNIYKTDIQHYEHEMNVLKGTIDTTKTNNEFLTQIGKVINAYV